jgi:Trk K+ transport system NAD-binding subunit
MHNESTIWLFLRKMRIPLIVLTLAHAIPVISLTLVPGIEVDGKIVYMSFFDAMYFVAYTATTIGFGEIPYAFSYPQRLIVFATIYITVPAWYYAVGSLIALMQEKTFINALKMNTFRRKVRRLRQDFIVICGYNYASKLLIEKLNQDQLYRIIVIDKNSDKIEQLNTESYMPSISSLTADASTTSILKSAGIQSPYCKYIITMFDDDQLNLKTSVRARILNDTLKIVSRSNVRHGSENLTNIGVDHVVDIFDIVAKRIDAALRSPYLFNLLSWVQGGNLHVSKSDVLPRGKYIVCSGGRFGKTLKRILDKNGIDYAYLDINKAVNEKIFSDKEFLIEAGMENASCIIAGTNDDAVNLSIIATARTLNANVFAIVRENEPEERSLFSYLHVDKIFILDHVAAIDAYNYVDRPLTIPFIENIQNFTNDELVTILLRITDRINKRPPLVQIRLDSVYMRSLYEQCQKQPLSIGQLLNNPYHDGKDLEIVILAIGRADGSFIILPTDNTVFEPNDEILLAATHSSLKKFTTIVNNYYELYFVIHGVEERRLTLPWKKN